MLPGVMVREYVCTFHGIAVAVGCLCSSWGWGSCECGMFVFFLG